MLRIENITKRFDDNLAVDHLSLEVEAGEIVGFLGHNGAGKTTTIKQIVTLLPIDEGKIYVNNIDVDEEPVKAKQQLFYVPDNPDLFENMSPEKYFAFLAQVYQKDITEITKRVEELATELEIADKLKDPIATFSHGMKQKVALIAAFMLDVKLILLDEPFVGLDPSASFKVKKLMRDFCDKGGAIFFSTHVLEVAEKLCDRLAIIRHGKLVKIGKTDEIVGEESLEEVFLELEGENASDAH